MSTGNSDTIMKILISLLSVLICLQAFSQNVWNGDVTVNYGSSFENNELGEHKWISSKCGAKASFKYTTPKFFIAFGGEGGNKFHTTLVSGHTVKADSTEDYSVTIKDIQNINAGALLRTGWTFSPADRLTFKYDFKYDRNTVLNGTLGSTGVSKKDSIGHFVLSDEKAEVLKGKHTAELSYIHNFSKPDRKLDATFNFIFADESNNSIWEKLTLDTSSFGDRYYRITPRMFDYEYQLKLKYGEKQLAGVEGLDADFSMVTVFKADEDFQRAATLVGTEWVDSSSYHEDFLFYELVISPIAHIVYSKKFYSIDASYTPQFYGNKLRNAYFESDFDAKTVSNLINVKNRFDFLKAHAIALDYDRSVKRPGYLQICPFERAGSQYSNVKYRGDPDLLPEVKHKFDLSYTYTFRRFQVTAGTGYEYKNRIIEQTYWEEMEDNAKYRIYTWINGGDSHIGYASAQLMWNGKNLKAALGGKINYFYGEANTGKITYSKDYSLNGFVSYSIRKWTFLARAKYESKIIRSYTSRDEIVKCDLRIDKTFGKFTIFLEGLDLFDKLIHIYTKNFDQTEERYEEIYNASRIYQAGVTFKF